MAPRRTATATPRVERRIAAILAADVVGYSSLMERDEDRTLTRLKAHRKELIEPLIAEYQGRIVKLMGDGILAEFASVVDAVRCAVRIQQTMAERERNVPEAERLRFRIGINLGDVIREPDGDLYGDGVNVAARLEQLAEPGGVLVSGTAYDHLQGKLDLPLEFAGEQRVKNIERLVRAYRVRLNGTATRLRRPLRQARRLTVPAAAVLLLVLAAIGTSWWWRSPGAPAGPPLPDEPSVAILPFDNPTGDARLGRLADGMVGDVIVELAKFGVFIIARGTSFAYRDKPHDPRNVGRDLGVQFVVEGSLEGDGSRLRATVGLVDAATGQQAWSARYDRPIEDLFAVQAELAQRIANSLGGTEGAMRRAQLAGARAKPRDALNAFDLYLLGIEARSDGTREGNQKGQALARQAIALDPSLARAYVLLAATYRRQIQHDWAPWEEAMAGWLDAANRAVALEPNNGWARLSLSDRYAFSNDLALSANELLRAAEVAEGDAALMIEVGRNLPWIGQTGRGEDLVEHGMRLDPGLADENRWTQRDVYFFARRFDEAAAAAEAIQGDLHEPLFWKTLIYAQLGKSAEVEQLRASLLAQDPDLSAELGFSTQGDFLMPQAAAERGLYLESFAKAGLPVCATPEQVARYTDMRHQPACDVERAKKAGSRT